MLGIRGLLGTAVGAVATTGFLMVPAPPSGQPGIDQPTGAGTSVNSELRIERNGTITVTETAMVPAGRGATETVQLIRTVTAGREQVYTVTDAAPMAGSVGIDRGDDALTLHFPSGTSTVKYTVTGAIAVAEGGEELRWQLSGVWDTEVAALEALVYGPDPLRTITCLAGTPGSATQCTLSQLDSNQFARIEQRGLAAGQRVEVAATVPPTVPPTAAYRDGFSLAGAFALTPASGIGLAVLLAALLGGVSLLYRARGRAAAALTRSARAGEYQPLVREASGTAFASPDSVLPGQIGTVIDENVHIVDVTATIVDLAVRNYLWIDEVAADGVPDWRLVARHPADDLLVPYERAVYDALLGGRREVRVSELRDRLAGPLPAVRDAMYADVVERNWFDRRPDRVRSRWNLIGAALIGLGVVGTVLLAMFTQLALLGLAVVVGGVATLLLGRAMPARTARGSALLAQVLWLRSYVDTASSDAVPAADRELVFSRSLPYAVVLGRVERWLDAYADLDPGADGTPGLYWYGGVEELDLRAFRARFLALLSALDGVLARPGRLRELASLERLG